MASRIGGQTSAATPKSAAPEAAHLADPLAGTLSIAPISVKAALAHVRAWHRHLPELQGGLFAASCIDPSGAVVAVAVAGNPARVWQGTGRIVISRVAASVAGNSCGMLYGALAAAAKALGYREAWTYTLPDEDGRTIRGAGFVDMGLTDGGQWDRPSRARAVAVRPERKRRWRRILRQDPLAAIRGAWCAETSYWPDRWTPENPACGQCAVTALAVQEVLGGDIWRGRVDFAGHYWNRVDGKVFDLTIGQFPEGSRRVVDVPVHRDRLLANADTARRYELLKAAISAAAA